MLPVAAPLAAVLLGTVPPFTVGASPGARPEPVRAPVPADKLDRVREGMTVADVVRLLGFAHVPALSGTGELLWTDAAGRTLAVSHTRDWAAVLTADPADRRPGRVRFHVRPALGVLPPAP